MDEIIRNYLSGLEIGEAQQFRNMAAFPIFTSLDGGPDYWTLKEALEKAVFSVTEVSAGGSVPELKVANKGDVAVLLLDGEELAGAKQNRVLNTTILVKEKSETVIPVSCTEQGRWSYVSRAFFDSDTVMSPKLRAEKGRTVAMSLERTGEYRSDQGTVWREIDRMAAKADTVSRTRAMKDVYLAKMKELDEYLAAFRCADSQRGLLVLVGGDVLGLDFLSRDKAFAVLFPKLIKSYAMEAILEARGNGSAPEKAKAERFLQEITDCAEKKYESVGRGWDYRYESKTIVGSALAVDGRVVHMAFFRVPESDRTGEMASTRQRRRFRF